MPRAVVPLCVLGAALTASMARAGTPPTQWWVEARPWTCSAQIGPLARQIQLACDATQSCAVARNEPSATRRAVLVCGEQGWTLDAQDASHAVVWSLALGAGDDDDARLRKAAIWVARSEGGDPLPGGDPSASPAAVEEDGPAPAAPLERDRPQSKPAAHDPTSPRFTLSAMGHASKSMANTDSYGDAAGGRVMITMQIPKVFGPLQFGVTGEEERDLQQVPGDTLFRAGGIVGVGAPFARTSFLGASVEGGAAALYGWNDHGDFSPGYGYGAASNSTALGSYVQASVYIQAPLGSFRPFLCASFSRLSGFNGDIPNNLLGLDVGLAWDPLR
jgi:hypothetical protein